MKIKELLKSIDGVFIPPVKRYYLGKIKYGTPYFNPMNFVPTIIRIRKLRLKAQEKLDNVENKYYRNDKYYKFSNLPGIRRSKHWIVKLFNYYYIEIGSPVRLCVNELGWKDKYGTPRFEWLPAVYFNFFIWQFCVWWEAPVVNGRESRYSDEYYEMILWYLEYSDKDIKKAKDRWGWADVNTKTSTWKNEYII